MIQIISIVYASENEPNQYYEFSQKKLNYQINDSITYVENLTIEGKDYKFVHREEDGYAIIEISGAEQGVYKAKLDSPGETFAIYRLENGEWHYFNYYKKASWKSGDRIADIVLILALTVNGPVSKFVSVATYIAGKYTSVDIDYSGKYRYEGSHIGENILLKYME